MANLTSKEEFRKCLEGLEVDKEAADRFIESFWDVYQQLIKKDVRISHPSLLKLRYVVEEMMSAFDGGYKKVLTSSTYSTSSRAQIFTDLKEVLQIQIDKTRQLLAGENKVNQ